MMTLPKNKSRDISVRGKGYRYAVAIGRDLGDDVFALNVTVQCKSGRGAKLTTEGLTTRDYWLDVSGALRHPSDYVTIAPNHVARMIKLGIERGWGSDDGGSPFVLELVREDLLSE